MKAPEEMKPIPDPDPPLSEGPIRLRWFRTEDAEYVAEACRDVEIPRWTFMEEGLTVERAREWIQQSHDRRAEGLVARFAVVCSDADALLGQVGVAIDWERLSGETFYWTAAEARERGVTTTALRLISLWALRSLALEPSGAVHRSRQPLLAASRGARWLHPRRGAPIPPALQGPTDGFGGLFASSVRP